MRFADLDAVADLVRERAGRGIDGVVVTQGTDSMEETAYHLDLRLDGPVPLVVTGAMRNPTQAGAAGPANLLAAIVTAAESAARDLGCLVVMDDQIYSAARVTKTHATSTGAFTSPNGGPIGHLVEGRAVILNRPTTRMTLPPPTGPRTEPRVPLFTAVLDDDGDLLDAVIDRVDGLVVAGFGAGHVPESLVPILARATARIPVVLSSRTGGGSVLAATYGFPGSKTDLITRGLLPGGHLHPVKARVLLRALLAGGAGTGDIEAAFAAAGQTGQPVSGDA